MSLLQFKILAIGLLFASGLFGGLVTLKISLSEKGKRLLALGNAFAGGIFLGAGLIHLLGDSVEIFGSMGNGNAYPWAFLICGCGFLGILMLEKVLVKGDESDVSTGGRSLYPYVLLLVLSVHSVIAGMTLGLEGTLTASIIIAIALVAHKGAAAFALGVGLRTSGVRTGTHKRLVAFFACMAPLGVVLGKILSTLVSSGAITTFEAVFDALAAGTFLYVAISDIIGETFESRVDALGKFLLLSTGFGFMALMAIWA